MPDVPAMAEAGLTGIESATWYGVLVPAHTPAYVVAVLNAAFVSVMHVYNGLASFAYPRAPDLR
ncbi:MAG: tripartite tricarboxylate transporter substrate-binding protein [Betaproteobacteria bacterium]